MTLIHRRLPACPSARLQSDEPVPSLHVRYALTRGTEPLPPGSPTPTKNTHLAFRRGGFDTLTEALDYAALGETGLNFYDGRGTLTRSLSYREVRLQAQAFARRLIAADVSQGDRVVLIADTWPGFCIAFFGCQYAGVVAAPVPVPAGLGAKASYIEQLRSQIIAANAVGVVAPDELAGFAVDAAAGTQARFAGSMATAFPSSDGTAPLRPFGPQDPCYIQFSSGSTRAPRGVDIRQDRLMANIDGSLAAQEIVSGDAGVSWLPLYHDMGLIGFVLAPMCAQCGVDLMAPHDFARRPLQWLSLISRRRATITYSPSFGYDLVARRAQTQSTDQLDLSSLRLAGIGAEMIQPAVLERFAAAFAPAGFDRRAFLPSYGLAEVCVGLAFTQPWTGAALDRFVDGETGQSREFVVCGRVMAGHRVEIRDGDGTVLGERRIGRLFVHGPSVMPGYVAAGRDVANVIHNGWLDTGDLGYWHGDQLVVTGRAKDLMIVNGRNIWPQDIEWRLETLPRIRRGDTCAFSVEADHGESVVVVVQGLPADDAARHALEGEIRQKVREAFAIDCRIVLISRQTGLPVTSSGKLRRSAAKAAYLAGHYAA